MVRGCSGGCSCVVGVHVYQILAAFSSFWVAIACYAVQHCQYNESVHRKEEHAS